MIQTPQPLGPPRLRLGATIWCLTGSWRGHRLTTKEVQSRQAPVHDLGSAPKRSTASLALSAGDVVERIHELLEVTYRSGDLGNLTDVLSETVYILLSLNTREAVYQRTYEALRARYPRWVDVEQAPIDDLAEVLQEGGLHHQRARYLSALLARVRDDNVAQGFAFPGRGCGAGPRRTARARRPGRWRR